MTQRSSSSSTPFLLLAGLVLAVTGYLAWHAWQAPVDTQEAADVATRATDVTVRAGGGNSDACSEMRGFTAPDQVDAAVARCEAVAAQARANGLSLAVRDLTVTQVDVGRSSGRVTVVGTLLTPGPPASMRFTWPLVHRDGHWRVAGGADVNVD
ncbi:hypothetical protein [Nocardioides cynanchi]|uniref:hypothetical protein n=1 Tax=Nocardioides cynanchi TaxID=2558918 RepID=UPI0012441947|nr:hypothetical protein [Nocardioides cynanchi]